MAAPRKPRASSAGSSASPATPAPASANPLIAALNGLTDEQRKTVLDHVHPAFEARSESYRRLLDAYEGTGDFLDGAALVRYGNEIEADYKKRKEMARYHNYYRALVNIYVRHVFRAGVTREAKSLPDLEAWWKDVDGAGTGVDRFMMRGAKLALAAGIAGVLVDKEPTPPTGPSKADDTAAVQASWFPATSIVDWHLRAGELRGVKLLEPKPRASILEPEASGDEATQTLIWTDEAWVRLDDDGHPIQFSGQVGETTLDFVPMAIVRPDPSSETPFLGYALGGDGKVFVALLNRCSEEDQVLRDQAFSILTCNVGKDGDVEAAKRQIGNDIGTTRALVVAGEVAYVTAEMGAPEQIRKNIEFLIREIYRMAHVRFERDSLDAESGQAIRLQFTELNEQLSNLASVLQDAELQMAKAWYAWRNPGDKAAIDEAFAKANVTIQYPREFFLSDLLEDLQKWAAAIKLDLGKTFEHYIKNRVVNELAPELPADLRETIRQEIDGMEQNRDRAMEEAQTRLAGSVARLTAAGGKKPEPPKPGEKPADGDAGDKAAA